MEALLSGEQHPGDAGGLVGQGDGGNFGRLVSDKLGQPRQVRGASALGMADNRHGAGNQQPAQILVTLFGDAPQSHLAAGGGLPRHQADPGRQLTPGLEDRRIGDRGRQRARRDRPDAGDARQALARPVRAMPGMDALFRGADLPLQ